MDFISRKLGKSRASEGLCRTPIVEQDCQVPDLPGRQERMGVLPTLVHTAGWGPRTSLPEAEIGNGLPYIPQGLQQSIHAVLRLDENLLAGQVDLKLNSS